MPPPDFHGMSDDELEQFILRHPDRFDIPGALFEYHNRQNARAIKAAAKLEQQTDQLVKLTDRLVQENLILNKFTKGIYTLSIVLGILAFIQIVIMVFEYCSKGH